MVGGMQVHVSHFNDHPTGQPRAQQVIVGHGVGEVPGGRVTVTVLVMVTGHDGSTGGGGKIIVVKGGPGGTEMGPAFALSVMHVMPDNKTPIRVESCMVVTATLPEGTLG